MIISSFQKYKNESLKHKKMNKIFDTSTYVGNKSKS